ncbi:helicase-related protein [Flavobacterium sp. MK4S-17]|uniref:helicase-related protein n=1 Tax=Flavobacterium sp. MK4S-17 TaxID=2543737 RepID=UPI00135A6846|nr:helicase-related protein [Flavobacterium sp. MK4S-17]
MDRIQRTIDIAKAINAYNTGSIPDYNLVQKVCAYFDAVKEETLSESDRQFLLFIANKVGIPHYYDMLGNTQMRDSLLFDEEDLGLGTFAAILYETSLYTDEKNKLHRFQKEILKSFEFGKLNRYFLSASTSFGKTHLTYEVIKKMKYENIILIFPTVALLTENLSRLKEKETYSYFTEQEYTIHTLSDGKEQYGSKNIFIFTPERYLSFLDKRGADLHIDFVFVDEVYKIDNEYMDNDEKEVKEHDRDLAYRMAIYYALNNQNVDLMLAGPYISFYKEDDPDYNASFDKFLAYYNITLINKNNYEIVNKSYYVVKDRKKQVIDGIEIDFTENYKIVKSKPGRLRIVLSSFFNLKPVQEQKTIVYCSTKVSAESYANQIVDWEISREPQDSSFDLFIEHLENTYHSEWCVIQALKAGVGIHHGVVPKYIQKEIVKLFNMQNGVSILVCTTTITEGVNTSAKNLIALFDTKGSKPLKAFDAKNIAGRAGRFMEHYQGSVVTIKNNFDKVMSKTDGGIRHKNFDVTLSKEGADLDMTDEEYLDETSKEKRIRIDLMQQERGIPEEVMQLFKTVSREDKIVVYDQILSLDANALNSISGLIDKILKNQIDFDGFQVVLDVIRLIVKDKNFIHLLGKSITLDENEQPVEKKYSRITYSLYYYLKDGFDGLFNYRIDDLKEDVDKAMRKASELVYNTFKYQLVKYLGVFNTMYKYRMSVLNAQLFDDVPGLDRLLTKLEYNAFSDQAKIASDYGVPQRIIDYYDATTDRGKTKIFNSFDPFERHVFDATRKLFQ